MNRIVKHLISLTTAGFAMFIIAIVLFFAFNYFMTKAIINKKVVQVPDFVGNEIEDVKHLAKALQLNVEIAEY
jgi:hypothetical protein